ncbi:MAG: arylesterase [Candidatus Omnitrophica bacterium]|nr:arylesterase [Candidatus Omnitrophota bacterium]
MKRNSLQFIVYGLLLVVVLLYLPGCAKKEIANRDSQGEVIVCFGDSITFGYGVDAKESYPEALKKMVDMPVINAGIDGDTTKEALKRLESDVLSHKPYLVIVEFGGNDFLKKIPFADTVNNLKEIVRKIQAAGAMVAVTDISAGFLMREYRAPYKKIAQETKAIFIPSIMGGIITNPRMKSDFFHPNADGYNIIASRIYRVIKPYLK